MCGWGRILICILKLLDIKVCRVDIDRNTESNVRPREHFNLYLCVQKTIKFFLYFTINYDVTQKIVALTCVAEGRGFDCTEFHLKFSFV